MSAFIVGNKHVNAMLKVANMIRYAGDGAGYYWKGARYPLAGSNAQLVAGQKLVDQNYRSVNYRYEGQEQPEEFELMPMARDFEPVEIIKACDCYIYQSCETSDWPKTEAYAIVHALRERAITLLHGYDGAEYNIR